MKNLVRLCALALVAGAPISAASAQVNGSIVGDGYGPAYTVQTVETQFGDNASELNAAYARISGGRLYLALTGNVEANFNKLEIFLDSSGRNNGTQNFTGIPGNDGSGVMGPVGGSGLVFDNGFAPDYHLIFRRGNDNGNDKVDLDFAVLNTGAFSSYSDILGGLTGSGSTGTGANMFPIDVGYDDSNVAGVLGGTNPANQAAAAAVDTGVELSIALADLGLSGLVGETVCIMAFQNNQGHNYASNQFLPGVPAPQGNFGGDMGGGFNGVLNLDLRQIAGDQFFCVPIPAPGTCGLFALAGLAAARRRR